MQEMHALGRAIFRIVLFIVCCFQVCAGSRRSAGGLGPELRSRVTQALDELEKAVAAQPENAQLWWQLGVQSQIAAGGVVEEERYSVAMLERAVRLDSTLLESYANVMTIADMLRGVRECSKARAYYSMAAVLNPLSSTHYIYAALTLEMEGAFADAARAFALACRVQSIHTAAACAHSAGSLSRFSAACFPSHQGSSTYLAYLTAALLKAHNPSAAASAYALALGYPPPASLSADVSRVLIADYLSPNLFTLRPSVLSSPSPSARLPQPLGWVAGGFGSFLAASPSLLPPHAELHAASAQAQAHLRGLQFRGGCRGGERKLVYVFSQAFGFGAHAHMLSLALSIAVATNRTLVPDPTADWWLVDRTECDGRGGFDCFFEAFTDCHVSNAAASSAIPLMTLGAEGLSADGGPENVRLDWEAQTYAIKFGLLRHFVPPFATKYGAAWWRGQTVQFVMRPRLWLAQALLDSQRRVGWLDPAIGLHIRHGDKLKEASRLSVDHYLPVLLNLSQAIGARSVFVSTDSPDVLAELEQRTPKWLKVCYEKDEIRGTDITNANLKNNLRLNVTRYTLEAVRGTMLLSRGAAFIGTFSSNFGRLAYELMITHPAQGKHSQDGVSHPFAVSLDLPWFAYP